MTFKIQGAKIGFQKDRAREIKNNKEHSKKTFLQQRDKKGT